MTDSFRRSWQDNPNAPKISSRVHSNEKANFAGILTCSVFYGIAIILFFRCMSALLNPFNRTSGGIKWLLVTHTVAIFLFVTVFTGINLNILSISYIDNRKFRGTTEPPGPAGFQYITYSTTISVVSTCMFLLNNLLVDGLLLYRCYIMYAMRHWVIIFPFLLYLATFVTGIMLVYYQISQPDCTIWRTSTINVGVPYSISVSLDVLLTFMIIARIVLLSREIRKAMNAPFRISALYKAIITVISESSALYAVTFLFWIGTWAANNPAEYFFFPLLAQVQVIAPFLITLQVVNRRTVTDVVSGDICTIPSSRGESTRISRTLSGMRPTSLMGKGGESPDEFDLRVMKTVDLHHDRPRGSFET